MSINKYYHYSPFLDFTTRKVDKADNLCATLLCIQWNLYSWLMTLLLILELLDHMYRFVMSNKVHFPICLIFAFWTLEFLAHMNRFVMRHKITFPGCLIFTICTLELLTQVYWFLMSNKVPFLCCLVFSLWTLKLSPLMKNELCFLTGLKSA